MLWEGTSPPLYLPHLPMTKILVDLWRRKHMDATKNTFHFFIPSKCVMNTSSWFSFSWCTYKSKSFQNLFAWLLKAQTLVPELPRSQARIYSHCWNTLTLKMCFPLKAACHSNICAWDHYRKSSCPTRLHRQIFYDDKKVGICSYFRALHMNFNKYNRYEEVKESISNNAERGKTVQVSLTCWPTTLVKDNTHAYTTTTIKWGWIQAVPMNPMADK